MKKIQIRFLIIIMSFAILLSACKNDGYSSSENNQSSTVVSGTSDIYSKSIDDTTNSSTRKENSTIENTTSLDSEIQKTKAPETQSSKKQSTKSTSIGSKPATTKASNIVKVTIPEGYSFSQIADLMEQKGVCSKKSLLSTAQTYDFSYYPLIAQIPDNQNRFLKLEGYLFPDTYEFYKNEKPENVLGKLIRTAEAKITQSIRTKAEKMGFSVDEIIILASIIEKEAGKSSEMKNISSVLHNRLKIERKLECDATINYVELYIKPNLTGDENRYNSYYNTYKCDALPSGAICNPSLTAINAALNPADTDYLFFVSDKNGNYYYANNGTDHKENVIKAGLEW
ncbi:MAG: endolytic transglycosylase MltG [Clostridiales bacterium]|nr:endolytic transglycosylase MltG [Clostridiales bacterium]